MDGGLFLYQAACVVHMQIFYFKYFEFFVWSICFHFTSFYHNKFLFDFVCFIIITDDKIITGGKS